MKKTLLLVLGLCSFLGYSQTEEIKETKNEKNNEIKINLPYFIYGLPELSYEGIIDSTSSAGISLAVAIDKPETVNVRLIVTPYYRLFFSKGKAKGFFIEGNAVVLSQKGYRDMYNEIDYNYTKVYMGTTTNLGFGAAVGAKFLNKNGYIGEIYAGGGRLFGVDSGHGYSQGYPRLGLSIGKRF